MIAAEDREIFERSLRQAVASVGDLDVALAALGWRDALTDDPDVAVSSLFELQGNANRISSALDMVMGGDADAAAMFPPLGSWSSPGLVEGGRGLITAATMNREWVLVGAARVRTSELKLRPVRGIDPEYGLVEVTGQVSAAAAPGDWDAALAAGQRALAHELVGASRAMLELARVHALDRVQFGRPIGSFQAVRHRLAESLVAIEAADAAVGAAWVDGTPLAAATAKAIAGRSARTVSRHSQQVLAGIGFTTEHPLHRYVRRVLVLDHLLGDARSLTAEIGRHLLATRQVPPMVAL